jgi:putative ABC transport system substrate-binding protein
LLTIEWDMRRRDFITLAGTAAAWPLVACDQPQATPVIGFFSSSHASAASAAGLLNAFRKGLALGGYDEGRNVAIEYRWAGGRVDQLPELLDDLVRRQVKLMVASGGFVSAMAAKAATKTIPILFIAGFDPVKMGLVSSINRPDGNATGVSVYTIELMQKRLEYLLKLIPKPASIALLVNPNPYGSEIEIEHLDKAASRLDLKLHVLKANADSDLDAILATAAEQRAGMLAVSADPFFTPRRARIVALAARHGIPAVYPWREYVDAGGLMSFGPTLGWAYERIGFYASRILKGAKPSELPVELPREFKLVINGKTVTALGLTLPDKMLGPTDEIIE